MEKFGQHLWYGKHKLTHSNFTWSSSYFELYALDLPRQANVGDSRPLKNTLRVCLPLAWVWAAGLPRWIRITIYQLSMPNAQGKAGTTPESRECDCHEKAMLSCYATASLVKGSQFLYVHR